MERHGHALALEPREEHARRLGRDVEGQSLSHRRHRRGQRRPHEPRPAAGSDAEPIHALLAACDHDAAQRPGPRALAEGAYEFGRVRRRALARAVEEPDLEGPVAVGLEAHGRSALDRRALAFDAVERVHDVRRPTHVRHRAGGLEPLVHCAAGHVEKARVAAEFVREQQQPRERVVAAGADAALGAGGVAERGAVVDPDLVDHIVRGLRHGLAQPLVVRE